MAPIPGDNPAGESVPFEVRDKLDEYRKEIDPTLFAEDDPMRPTEMKKADWPAIIRLTTETLSKTSKDLLTAARLTEALTKQQGFAGLRDGLHLFGLLIEQCWDRLNPPIETPDDVERRAGPFNWLDDPDRGARFPNAVRGVPMVAGEGGQYGWIEWKQSQDGKGAVSREDFDKAILATPAERCETTVQDLNQCFEELNHLTQILAAKMGPAAPALTGLRQALDECRMLGQQILKMKVPAGGEALASVAGGKVAPAVKAAGSRAEAYRQLEQAAAVLQQLEPHSPIPYLVQRAIKLGSMPFPMLIRELVREPGVLTELNRELGIKEESKEAAG